MQTNAQDSSVSVEPFEVGDMTVIRHFTGALLLSTFEANHLRTLLNQHLTNAPEMPIEEASRIVAEREALVADAIAG